MKNVLQRIEHPINPIYNENSRILILGSFPSVRSREEGFFYGHKQNRFWRVTAAVFGKDIPVTVSEKKAFLLDNGIAVWDVIASCDIAGSSDSSIRNVIPNDISVILSSSLVSRIFTNGATANKLYSKYIFPTTGIPAECLPSTSPANAAWSIEKLTEVWQVIKN